MIAPLNLNMSLSEYYWLQVFPFHHLKYDMPLPSDLQFLLKNHLMILWEFPCILFVAFPLLLLIFPFHLFFFLILIVICVCVPP